MVGLIYPRSASADLILDVTLDTSALTVGPGASSGPFSLFFQLTDGSGAGDGNNTVVLSGFTFGGGGASGSATLEGGSGGDLDSEVTLVDSSFFNSFMQGFTPGDLLSFALTMTTNLDAGGVPDAFAFSILDGTGFPIATLDPTLADTLMTIVVESASPAVQTYGTDPARTDVVLSAPSAVSTVPEPASLSLLLLGTGIASLARCYSRRRWKLD
jgi:hypothetical protein